MPGKGHSPEQVLNKLRQVEVAVAGGKSVGQAVHGRTATTESFNGKLRDELLNREIFYSLKEVQILTERRRREYNTVRPPVPEAIMPELQLVANPR